MGLFLEPVALLSLGQDKARQESISLGKSGEFPVEEKVPDRPLVWCWSKRDGKVVESANNIGKNLGSPRSDRGRQEASHQGRIGFPKWAEIPWATVSAGEAVKSLAEDGLLLGALLEAKVLHEESLTESIVGKCQGRGLGKSGDGRNDRKPRGQDVRPVGGHSQNPRLLDGEVAPDLFDKPENLPGKDFIMMNVGMKGIAPELLGYPGESAGGSPDSDQSRIGPVEESLVFQNIRSIPLELFPLGRGRPGAV